MHIASGTKGRVTCSGQHHDIDVWPFTTDVQGITHFSCCRWGKGIPIAFTIDGDAGNAVVEIEQDFLIFFDGCPIAHIIQYFNQSAKIAYL